MVQQHRLADSRVAAQDQHLALTGQDRSDQPFKRVAFADAVLQLGRAARPYSMCRHQEQLPELSVVSVVSVSMAPTRLLGWPSHPLRCGRTDSE